jgi:hypothetical protein
MSFIPFPQTIQKQKTYRGIFLLLVFCAAFFAHSEHYRQVLPETSVTSELHECYFCQQVLDSLPNHFDIFPTSVALLTEKQFQISDQPIVLPAYVYPPLRAPPIFNR